MSNDYKGQKIIGWLSDRVREATAGAKHARPLTDKMLKHVEAALTAVTEARSGKSGSSDSSDSSGRTKKSESDKAPLSISELKEFVVWLKERMKETPLQDDERREIGDWLAKRMSEAGHDAADLDQVRQELH